jgi:hypothetical protein
MVLLGDKTQMNAHFGLLLGDGAQMEARFGSFGDCANLDLR